ncbi:MAG TPA: hypothetical protein VE843_16295, partial [Ktedonobacteraceae bacterium]|nr:hypothetical protein [Ktedonobacteraceae bacterium]
MSICIGVKCLPNYNTFSHPMTFSLKREALLFDRIAIPDLFDEMSELEDDYYGVFVFMMKEIEPLAERKIVFEPLFTDVELAKLHKKYPRVSKSYGQAKKARDKWTLSHIKDGENEDEHFFRANEVRGLNARYYATLLREVSQCPVYP